MDITPNMLIDLGLYLFASVGVLVAFIIIASALDRYDRKSPPRRRSRWGV